VPDLSFRLDGVTAGYACAGDVIMLNTRVSQIDALPRR
jgi:hypothetical protein